MRIELFMNTYGVSCQKRRHSAMLNAFGVVQRITRAENDHLIGLEKRAGGNGESDAAQTASGFAAIGLCYAELILN